MHHKPGCLRSIALRAAGPAPRRLFATALDSKLEVLGAGRVMICRDRVRGHRAHLSESGSARSVRVLHVESRTLGMRFVIDLRRSPESAPRRDSTVVHDAIGHRESLRPTRSSEGSVAPPCPGAFRSAGHVCMVPRRLVTTTFASSARIEQVERSRIAFGPDASAVVAAGVFA